VKGTGLKHGDQKMVAAFSVEVETIVKMLLK
jgi:hypothetical protein